MSFFLWISNNPLLFSCHDDSQPGGVAKVIQVHTESDGSILYDVQYVLDRRKEKRVDAVFVSFQSELDAATRDQSVVGYRRPRSTRHANSGSNERVEKDKAMFGGRELSGKTLAVIGLGTALSVIAFSLMTFGSQLGFLTFSPL